MTTKEQRRWEEVHKYPQEKLIIEEEERQGHTTGGNSEMLRVQDGEWQ
jgi:hypothetical protein